MNKFKKVICLILTFIIISNNSLNVYASESSIPAWIQPIVSLAEGIQAGGNISADLLKNSLIGGLQGVGFIANGIGLTAETLVNYLRGYNNGQFADNDATDQEVINNASNYFINNINQTSNSVTYNNNSRSLLTGLANQIINDNGFWYCYTANWNDSVTTYPNGVMFNYCKTQLTDNQDNYYIVVRSGVDTLWLSFIPKNNNICFVANGQAVDTVNARMYDRVSWNPVQSPNWPEGIKQLKIVNENGTINTYESTDWSVVDGYSNYFTSANMLFNPDTVVANSGNWGGIGGSGYYMSYGKKFTYLVYKNVESMKLSTQGQQGYYQSSNYQDFSKSNSDNYTVDSSNSNNVTYGDVNNYINNYYGTNGTYPDPTQINVYIDNNNPSDDGGNGGGSGGGGNGDDPTFDLGFLGTIGRLIGSLITGIGNLITGILEGIVNALTGILSFLTTLINDIASVIPQGIMDLFSAILGWLPEEWKTVISLGILSMVLIGIFKIFK